MAKAIGLDIGSRCIKVVELDGSPKKFKVSNFKSVEIPGDGGPAEGEIVADALGEVVRDAKVQRDSIVAAMDSRVVVIREIMVPFLQDDQIRRVLTYEAEAHLHNYAIEDVVVDYVKVGEVQDQSKILIFAAPKDRVLERIELLRQNGVDPMHIDLDMTALFNAAEAVGAFIEHPNCVVLDIGATTTTILFVQDGKMKSCRSLRSGTESVTRVLSEDLAIDKDAVREKLSRGDGTPRDDDLLGTIELDASEDETIETEKSAAELERSIVLDRQGEFLGRIYRETTRSMASYSAESGVTAIYLTGGASLSGGIERRLGERFRKDVIRLDFLRNDSAGVAAADHDFANASMGVGLGCALKLLGYEGIDLEFRREELRYTRKFDLVKVALASTVSLIFILMFLTWLNYQNTLRVRRSEYVGVLGMIEKKYVAQARDQYVNVMKDVEDAEKLGKDPADVMLKQQAWQRQLDKMHEHITGKMGFNVRGIPPIRSALAVWRDLAKRLEDIRGDLGYLWLDDFKVNQKTISFEGLIGHRGNVDLLDLELKKLDFVKEVQRDRTEVDPKTGKARFGLTAYLKPTTVEGK